MSGSAGDKPFAPSEHKLRQARLRGETLQVRDLPAIAATLAAAGLIWALSGWLIGGTQALFVQLIDLSTLDQPPQQVLKLSLMLGLRWVFLVSAALLLPVALASVAVRRFIIGPIWSMQPLAPKIERLNPVAGLKRMLSGDTWFGLVKSLGAAGLVLGALWLWWGSQIEHLRRPIDSAAAIQLSTKLLWTQILIGSMLLLALAGLDLLYQHWSFRRRMRMDMKELRDEFKQLEGSPEVKSARKGEHRRLAQG